MKKLLLFLLLSTAGYAQLNIQSPQDYTICDGNGSGFGSFDLTMLHDALLSGLTPSQYDVTYYETLSNAENNVNSLPSPEMYTNITPFLQTIYVRVQDTSTLEYGTTSFNIVVNPAPFSLFTQPLVVFDTEEPYEDLTAVVSLDILGEELINNLPNSNENVTVSFYLTANDAETNSNPINGTDAYTIQGESVIFYRIENIITGCYFGSSFDVIVLPGDYETPPPTAPLALTFHEGDTLGDIELEGENIQWYDTDGTITLPPDPATDALPSTTVLEDGKTYYATQTVYGIESNDRLPVTVSFTMGLNDTAFTGLQHYPNPVKNKLYIINNDEIDSVVILNGLGQTLDTVIVKSNNIEASFDHLSSGIYFVKITSGNHQRTLKIVKE